MTWAVSKFDYGASKVVTQINHLIIEFAWTGDVTTAGGSAEGGVYLLTGVV